MIGFVNLTHSRITWEENLTVELSRSGRPGVCPRGITLIVLIKVDRPANCGRVDNVSTGVHSLTEEWTEWTECAQVCTHSLFALDYKCVSCLWHPPL